MLTRQHHVFSNVLLSSILDPCHRKMTSHLNEFSCADSSRKYSWNFYHKSRIYTSSFQQSQPLEVLQVLCRYSKCFEISCPWMCIFERIHHTLRFNIRMHLEMSLQAWFLAKTFLANIADIRLLTRRNFHRSTQGERFENVFSQLAHRNIFFTLRELFKGFQ